jgi:DNA polymerase III subunit delta'
MKIYPWHNNVWSRIMNQKARLPHAMLLHGRSGTGKLEFSKLFSKSLLCENPVEKEACGVCAKCSWFDEGSHPDFKLISPEDAETSDDTSKKRVTKKTQISVDQIRQLIQLLSLSNHDTTGLRVVLIHPAEALNTASANALLKVLEEPPQNTIFILVAHQIRRLLPTIVSRCQAIAMPLPEKVLAIQWLESQQIEDAEMLLDYYGGAPLAVLNADEMGLNPQIFKQLSMGSQLDTFLCASLLIQYGMEHAITMLQKWTYDILLCKYSIQQYYHAQHTSTLQALTKSVNLTKLLDFQGQLVQMKLTANHPLNQELQLENLLVHYKVAFEVI